jgi:hypothetical protein
MKKSDIIFRIKEIMKDDYSKRKIIQFNYDYYLYWKSEKGSIHLYLCEQEHNTSVNINRLQKHILANILYEIGNKQDMIDMKDYLIVTTYAICKNRLNKSYED